ncbi:hypothetical protein B0H11DRAFT_1937652 [Mycena galericulata]|nr:hypothetical protein B0H11DRAFT_1937652 [Mycena galericulata]
MNSETLKAKLVRNEYRGRRNLTRISANSCRHVTGSHRRIHERIAAVGSENMHVQRTRAWRRTCAYTTRSRRPEVGGAGCARLAVRAARRLVRLDTIEQQHRVPVLDAGFTGGQELNATKIALRVSNKRFKRKTVPHQSRSRADQSGCDRDDG